MNCLVQWNPDCLSTTLSFSLLHPLMWDFICRPASTKLNALALFMLKNSLSLQTGWSTPRAWMNTCCQWGYAGTVSLSWVAPGRELGWSWVAPSNQRWGSALPLSGGLHGRVEGAHSTSGQNLPKEESRSWIHSHERPLQLVRWEF